MCTTEFMDLKGLISQVTTETVITFPADVYGLLDQPGKMVWLVVNHCRLGPVDCVILLVCVVS